MARKSNPPGKYDPDNWTCLGGKWHCPGTSKVKDYNGKWVCSKCGNPTGH